MTKNAKITELEIKSEYGKYPPSCTLDSDITHLFYMYDDYAEEAKKAKHKLLEFAEKHPPHGRRKITCAVDLYDYTMPELGSLCNMNRKTFDALVQVLHNAGIYLSFSEKRPFPPQLLRLYESAEISPGTTLQRVPGGWIYQCIYDGATACFVPYSNHNDFHDGGQIS